MCGVTGLKPTVGLVSNHGVMPLVPSFDCVGPLCRSARDAARMLAIIAGPDPADGATALAPSRDYEAGLDGQLRGLRIAVPQRYYRDALDTEIERLTAESLRVLADAGATLVETDVPDMTALNALAAVMVGVEAATLHRCWLEERPHDYADQVRARIEPGLHYPAVRYAEALMLRGAMAGEWLAAAMGDADVVHVPTLPVPVPTIEETTSGTPADVAAAIGRLTHCTRAVNYLGFPAMAVPCGFTASGLPASMQLIGRPFAEATLLKVADAYQRRTDWHDRMPPLVTSVTA
jgi:aspartyl-tRNA(Asn)/glutamyl-tRNA(Gln) amidotransferase subunit A